MIYNKISPAPQTLRNAHRCCFWLSRHFLTSFLTSYPPPKQFSLNESPTLLGAYRGDINYLLNLSHMPFHCLQPLGWLLYLMEWVRLHKRQVYWAVVHRQLEVIDDYISEISGGINKFWVSQFWLAKGWNLLGRSEGTMSHLCQGYLDI